jgi:excisionase family DNA binding protein
VKFRRARLRPLREVGDRAGMRPDAPTDTAVSSPLVGLREARFLLGGISAHTLYRLISDGDLRLVKLRRRSFIRRAEVEQLIERSTLRTAS